MRRFYLDYNKWICGRPNHNENRDNCLGNGYTGLLNDKGLMCCLGQFCSQAGYTDDVIASFSMPNYTFTDDSLFVTGREPSQFSVNAAEINDSLYKSVAQKVKELLVLCAENNVELTLVNFPENILEQVSVSQ